MKWLLIRWVTLTVAITLAAYLTDLPLLYPPLGPTAFILFYTPMAVNASPRNVFLSHSLAVSTGLLSIRLVGLIFPDAALTDPTVMDWHRVAAIALAMGVTGVLLITVRCPHPPSAASALIAAMGFLTNPIQVLGLIVAVVLLLLEAFTFIRILGGLPYPVWRADPVVSRGYGVLAGIPTEGTTFWEQLEARLFQRR